MRGTIIYLMEKEVKQFIRNPFLPRLAIIFPIMVMFFIPLVATLDISDININIVDKDRSEVSQRLINKIDASTYFNLHAVKESYSSALNDIEYGDADIILDIPYNFGRDLQSKTPVSVGVSANSVNGTKGGLGANYLVSIINDFSQEFGDSNIVRAQQSSISIQNIYNNTQNYRYFMLPSIMIIIIILMCGFLPALNIVSEKEIGTMEQINVTPVGKMSFILAKLIPYWILGIAVLSLCFLLAYIVYGLSPRGSFFTIYGISIIFILTMSGFGLIISNYSSTMQQSMLLTFFFVMIFMLMSGLITPVKSMPEWAQCIATFNPPRYIIDVMRNVYLKGSSFADMYKNFLALSAFAVFFNAWAIIGYRKRS